MNEIPVWSYRKTWWEIFGKLMVAACVALILICACMAITAHAEPSQASWYSVQSLKDEGTWKTSKGVMANGKQFNDEALTCATRDFALGCRLMVTNLSNGKSVVVVVTDRIGKRFAGKRIDLSRAAFASIADLDTGVIPIKINVIERKK